MSRIAYVNGAYQPLAEAAVHIEDRGYQFADGVYEVCEVRGGRLADENRHLARLRRSLGELRIPSPMGDAALKIVMREVVRRNRIRDGLLYLQVTRGSAPRGHAFPTVPTMPSLVITARRSDPAAIQRAAAGIAVIIVPDTRWARVDIKSIGLLANVLAKQAAKEAGASEAWFIDKEGLISEGSSSNAWIVTAEGELITPPTSAPILRGVTRGGVLEVAEKLTLKVVERPFTRGEAESAVEAFITSATTHVTPVVKIDGRPVGTGAPGRVAAALRAAFLDRIELSPV